MNRQECEKAFWHWLDSFVATPQQALRGWAPCPFARRAQRQGQIELVWLEPGQESTQIRNLAFALPKPVVVFMFDPLLWSAEDCLSVVSNLNQELMPLDRVLLEDHPDSPELHQGLTMNFGSAGLVLAQRLSELNRAADYLMTQGYYEPWTPENYNTVVAWRYITHASVLQDQSSPN